MSIPDMPLGAYCRDQPNVRGSSCAVANSRWAYSVPNGAACAVPEIEGVVRAAEMVVVSAPRGEGAAEKVVSIIRGQVLNLFERTRWIGKFDVIRVTGGASRSKGIRDTIADVFGAKVETLDVPDSAALGGALMAARIMLAP